MRKITEIIVHCTATRDGRSFTVRDIDAWHRERGFRSIGYHWVVYLDGTIHPGRPEAETGAHCKGHNQKSVGVVYVGGPTAGDARPTPARPPSATACAHSCAC